MDNKCGFLHVNEGFGTAQCSNEHNPLVDKKSGYGLLIRLEPFNKADNILCELSKTHYCVHDKNKCPSYQKHSGVK